MQGTTPAAPSSIADHEACFASVPAPLQKFRHALARVTEVTAHPPHNHRPPGEKSYAYSAETRAALHKAYAFELSRLDKALQESYPATQSTATAAEQ